MRAAALRTTSARIAGLRALCLLGFLVLAARAAHLTVIETRGLSKADGQVTTYLNLRPGRGVIYDRNGVELAVTVRVPSVFVIPGEVKDMDATARGLGRALDVPRAHISRRLQGRDSYTFIARWVTREQAERVQALDLPGVEIEGEPRRAYPFNSLAGSLLGFANIDGEGAQGLELQEDEWLRGRARRVRVERDARGHIHSQGALDPATSRGGDLLLTIDASMQAAAEQELRDAVAHSQSRGGIALTLDPQTGDILSLAEAPAFDPNEFRRTPYAESRSRAFIDAVEPGSTLKPFLVAAALEADVLRPEDVFDCSEGWIRVRGKTIRDHRPYGILTPADILRVSSNVGVVQIVQGLGSESYHAALAAFGFGARTDSGFPSESAGLLRGWRRWEPVDQANVAFGQGVSVTPVQLAAAMGALANGGLVHTPRLVAARREPDGRWNVEAPLPPRRAIGEATANAVLDMLEGVVSADGTGRRAALRGVRVAGKTGTAQKYDLEKKSYSRDRYIAWFMGAVPAENPRLVIVVGLDEPGVKAHGGGDVAAPAFARIAAAQLARLGIITEPAPIPARRRTPETAVAAVANSQTETVPTPAPEPAPVSKKSRPLPDVATGPASTTRHLEAVFLPDFTGLSVGEVLKITKTNHLQLERVGSGQAFDQEPSPGSVITGPDRKIRVRFTARSGEG